MFIIGLSEHPVMTFGTSFTSTDVTLVLTLSPVAR